MTSPGGLMRVQCKAGANSARNVSDLPVSLRGLLAPAIVHHVARLALRRLGKAEAAESAPWAAQSVSTPRAAERHRKSSGRRSALLATRRHRLAARSSACPQPAAAPPRSAESMLVICRRRWGVPMNAHRAACWASSMASRMRWNGSARSNESARSASRSATSRRSSSASSGRARRFRPN